MVRLVATYVLYNFRYENIMKRNFSEIMNIYFKMRFNIALVVNIIFCFITGFPSVIACVDGTLITICKPWTNANDYYSRHNKPQLNIMIH